MCWCNTLTVPNERPRCTMSIWLHINSNRMSAESATSPSGGSHWVSIPVVIGNVAKITLVYLLRGSSRYCAEPLIFVLIQKQWSYSVYGRYFLNHLNTEPGKTKIIHGEVNFMFCKTVWFKYSGYQLKQKKMLLFHSI